MFSSRVLQCQVLYWYLNLQAIWSLFLCMVCVCVCVCVVNSLTNMQLSSFPNTTCQRDCVFSVYTLASFVEDYLTIGVCLFVHSLFCSIDPYVSFCTNTVLLWVLQLCSTIWNLGGFCIQQNVQNSILFFFLKIALTLLGLLLFHINFWIICSSSVKNVMGNLIGIMINL